MKKIVLSCTLVILVASQIGCTKKNNDGALERTGEKIDEAVENVKDGESPFTKKGPMEKLGESVDKAVGSDKNNGN